MDDMELHDRIDEWASRALDGELAGDDAARYEAHLEVCASCAERAEELAGAVGALRGLPVRPLDSDEVGAIVAAAMPGLPTAAGAAAAPAAAGVVLAGPGSTRRRRVALAVTHAAALVVGLGLAWSLGARAEAEPVERVVRVEVPVDREVRVEVPVEVVKEVTREVLVEVPVEVIVEKPVEVEVDVPVPHPFQARWDGALAMAQGVASLAAHGADAFGAAMERRADRIAAAEAAEFERAVASAPVVAQAEPAPVEAQRTRTGLVVRREGGRVSLRTRGTLDEVVPALIDALENEDVAVAAAALDRLEDLRDELGGDGPAAMTSFAAEERPVDDAGGIRGLLRASRERRSDEPAPDAAEAWRAWWRTRAG